MLQQMRKYAKSWVASIFLGALALSFGVWGIADIFRGGPDDTSVATVGSTKIPLAAFQRAYQNTLRNESQRAGVQITPEQAQRMGLPASTLQSLISQTALADEVDRLGLMVSDAQVASVVRSIPAFTGPLGTFDHATFVQRLQESGYTEQGFIDAMRNDDARQQLLSAAQNGFSISPGLARALFSYLNEKRAVQYVMVPANAAGALPQPSDAVLSAYIKSHPDRFSTPEYRALTYAAIGPADVANAVQVTDDQIKQEYELRSEDPKYAYVVPEKRDVEQLNFHDAASAKAARAKIDAGTSFADLAKSLGTAPISLGSVGKPDLGDRGAAVFALPDNGVTQPVKNLSGYALFHVTKIELGSNKSLADVKDDIRKDIAAKLAASKLDDVATAYTDASSGGEDLADAAKKVGMHVTRVPAVDSNGLAPDGSKAAIPNDPDFLAQVFHAEVGQEGDPFATKDGDQNVLKVEGVTPSKLKPLDAVRAQATAMWLAEARDKALAQKAQSLAAQASNAHGLAGVAKELNATPQMSQALSRDMPSGDLSAPLVSQIFSVAPGNAVAGPSSKGNGYIVALVTGVAHPPAPLYNPNYQKFIDAISSEAGQDIVTSMALAARNKQGVKINQKQVDLVAGGGGGS
jgi:peptidyl-prolyl cis-trans isomerase D